MKLIDLRLFIPQRIIRDAEILNPQFKETAHLEFENPDHKGIIVRIPMGMDKDGEWWFYNGGECELASLEKVKFNG